MTASNAGALAVAVDEDLPDQRRAGVDGLQVGHRDELALSELEHVVAAVDVDQMVRGDLGHHVAGAVVAFGVEHLGGDVGPLVVAGYGRRRLDQQLTARVRLVGGEVAQLGHVDELVVDHRRARDRRRRWLTPPISVSP